MRLTLGLLPSHIHRKFRDALKQYFFVKSSSIHKYSIPGGTKLLQKHNDSLRELFEATAPIGFSVAPAKSTLTGEESDQ